ncbi:Electron transfer flavoprotein, beta subunit [Leminorella richardii]|uniref:Electron transfer flavoprotein, beta subunit n=1 Tax=Leminorella richardii TaxID=158841 RepID=A0A2X4USF6_9GAMM|nr:hypothetical protein [Leminorella richardii]SQI42757.1 Electron transfer flavoprotein, beta subunit [Leminorella richardii]
MKSLNVTLGFRASADLAALAEKDWQPDARLRIDTQYVPSMLNCFDESAAELMLRLRDSAEVQNVELALCALTIDDGRADRHLKNLGALGFGEMVRIDALPEGIDLRFNPQAAAKMVAAWHGHSPQRLIVMGMESGDGVDFQTALCLAEALGWPCVTQVSDVSLRPEASGEVNEIVVIRRAEAWSKL